VNVEYWTIGVIFQTDSADVQLLKLMSMVDNVGRYYQIGSTDTDCDMYTLSVTIDAASGLLQVHYYIYLLMHVLYIVTW